MDEKKQKYIHHGHNIKRIRIAQKVKQAALASEIGVSQQTIARMEKQQVLPEKKIKMVAKALDVPEEVIKEMEEDPMTIIIKENTFENGSIGAVKNIENYNSIDYIKEILLQNTKMFERILQQDKERIQLLEQLLKSKN